MLSNFLNIEIPILEKEIPYIPTKNIIDIIAVSNYNINKLYKKATRKVEGKKEIPLINISFQYHLFRNENIPTPNELLQDYKRDNFYFLKKMPEDIISGIEYRVMRSYPSLVRDVHFTSAAKELGYKAKRTLMQDLNGIDVMIKTNNGQDLAVCLYLDSKKSKKYKINKDKQRKFNNMLNIGLNKKNRIKIKDIFLYDPIFIDEILVKHNAKKGDSEMIKALPYLIRVSNICDEIGIFEASDEIENVINKITTAQAEELEEIEKEIEDLTTKEEESLLQKTKIDEDLETEEDFLDELDDRNENIKTII